jgi:hypothetical protein
MSIQWQIALWGFWVLILFLNFRLILKQQGINQAILSVIIWNGFTLDIILPKYSGLGLFIIIIAGIISLILWQGDKKKKQDSGR